MLLGLQCFFLEIEDFHFLNIQSFVISLFTVLASLGTKVALKKPDFQEFIILFSKLCKPEPQNIAEDCSTHERSCQAWIWDLRTQASPGEPCGEIRRRDTQVIYCMLSFSYATNFVQINHCDVSACLSLLLHACPHFSKSKIKKSKESHDFQFPVYCSYFYHED